MRLLCCSDTHGRVPPVLDEAGATAWLHAGDVCHGPDVGASMMKADPHRDPLLAPVANWFHRTLPIHVVRGNHDSLDVYGAFADGRDVSGRVVALAPGVWLAGIGWHGERHYELPTEREIMPIVAMIERQLLRLARTSDAVVLLTHYCPVLDDRLRECDDSLAIRILIERVRPVFVVEGHAHRRAGETHVISHDDGSESTIHNPGASGVAIDLDLIARRATIDRTTPGNR